MKRTGGSRRKTRYKYRKQAGTKGKISLKRYLQTFAAGDKVAMVIEPSIQKGMCHHRFAGRSGIILSKKGRCYCVSVNDQGKLKKLIVHPIHLKKV